MHRPVEIRNSQSLGLSKLPSAYLLLLSTHKRTLHLATNHNPMSSGHDTLPLYRTEKVARDRGICMSFLEALTFPQLVCTPSSSTIASTNEALKQPQRFGLASNTGFEQAVFIVPSLFFPRGKPREIQDSQLRWTSYMTPP